MKIKDLQISTSNHVNLAATLYLPYQPRNKIIIFNSAIGTKRNFYQKLAIFLQQQGFTCLTYDYRGIGDSKTDQLKQCDAKLADWGQKDIPAVLNWVQQNFQNYKYYMIAHSAGGQLIGLVPNNSIISGLVAIATPSGYWQFWPSSQKYKMALMMFVLLPILCKLYGYFPASKLGLGEDLPKDVALQWAKWCRHPRYLLGYQTELNANYYSALKAPILAYTFSDDTYATRKANEQMLDNFINAEITHHYLTPQQLDVKSIGHVNMFREEFKHKLWQDIAAWLIEH